MIQIKYPVIMLIVGKIEVFIYPVIGKSSKILQKNYPHQLYIALTLAKKGYTIALLIHIHTDIRTYRYYSDKLIFITK